MPLFVPSLYARRFARILRTRWLSLTERLVKSFNCAQPTELSWGIFFPRPAVEGADGIEPVPADTPVQNCCPPVVSGDSAPSPPQVAARPPDPLAPKPLASEPAGDSGKCSGLWHIVHMKTKLNCTNLCLCSHCTTFVNLQFLDS